MNPSTLKKKEGVKLNYKQMGSGQPLIVLHGLFGSLDNWMTLGRRWSEDFSVYLLDLRNHGRSPHTPEHTLDAMADEDRKSTRLNSSHVAISYAVFCLKKKKY